MHTYSREIIFAVPHKSIRKSLFELGYQAGRTDFSIAAEVEQLKKSVDELQTQLLEHAAHEEKHVFPLIEARRPGVTTSDISDHEEIESRLETLVEELHQFAAGQGLNGQESTFDWYIDLCQFISDYLEHMTQEEQITARHIQELFTFAELQEIQRAITASLTPEGAARSLRQFLPAFHHTQRVGFFLGLKSGAPAPVYKGALGVAAESLSTYDMQRLVLALAEESVGVHMEVRS